MWRTYPNRESVLVTKEPEKQPNPLQYGPKIKNALQCYNGSCQISRNAFISYLYWWFYMPLIMCHLTELQQRNLHLVCPLSNIMWFQNHSYRKRKSIWCSISVLFKFSPLTTILDGEIPICCSGRSPGLTSKLLEFEFLWPLMAQCFLSTSLFVN